MVSLYNLYFKYDKPCHREDAVFESAEQLISQNYLILNTVAEMFN